MTFAAVAVTARCGGDEASAPATTDAVATTTGVSSGSSSEAGTTESSTPTGQGFTTYLLERDTFSFEYPIVWSILDSTPEKGPEPLEKVLVGPGNATDGVTMHVFRERGFETEQEARDHVVQLREDVRREHGRLIEGPSAFRRDKDLTLFYLSYNGRTPLGDKIVRQVGLIYFRGRLYRFTCQFAPSHELEMAKGCKNALDTLKIEGLEELPQ